jgi:predicted NodU family carbamoyl transferase
MGYVIGISAYYHDSSACLFRNGQLIFACEEEKFTGIKHDSTFPVKTLDYIFKKYKLKLIEHSSQNLKETTRMFNPKFTNALKNEHILIFKK